jgi:8-oxo-dGTP pyrophosphatase MutT (NUDIX family)
MREFLVKSLIHITLSSFFLLSCVHTTEKQKNSNQDNLLQVDSFDDLYENTPKESPFARPVGGNIGFDIDGVLHTEVQYSAFGDYNDPVRPIFETKGRNKRLIKEIDLLLKNGNKPFIVTHNASFCSPKTISKRQIFLTENHLSQIENNEIFCIKPPTGKSGQLKETKIDTFYDDSPKVLAEVSKNKPNTKLFMVLPHQEKVAHYFAGSHTERVENCGVLVIDNSKPKKRLLLQLRSESLGSWWNFPGGSCALAENKLKNCSLGECEDPITGAIREFNEEAGKERDFNQDIIHAKRLMVLHSNKYMLLVAKFDNNYLTKRSFIPDKKHSFEVSNTIFNIQNSPGYRWFDLDECDENVNIEGHPLNITGNFCKEFKNYLEKI